MSIFEYDKEWEEKKLGEAEYEAGRQECENDIRRLFYLLEKDNRKEDIFRAMKEPEFLKKLFEEYGIR